MINARQLRVQALQTAMKNPRLAKLLVSAAKAPLGSTARTQAQNVINSLYSTQLNHVQSTIMPTVLMQQGGGQGGSKNQMMPVMVQPHTPPQGRVVVLRPATLTPYAFKRPVRAMLPEGYVRKAPVVDKSPTGQGGERNIVSRVIDWAKSKFSGQGGGLNSNTTYGPLQVVSGPQNLPNITIAKPQNNPQITVQKTAGPLPNLTVTNTPSPTASNYNPQTFVGPVMGPTAPKTNNYNPQQQGANALQPASTFSNLYNSGAKISTPPPAPSPTPPPTPSYMSSGDQGFVGPTQDSSSTVTNQPGTFDANGKYIPTGDPLIDYLMQSYGQGIGANAFALGAMSDAKKLQELLPGVPANQLPVGASLAGQLSALQDALYKEYKIDDLHTSLNQAVQAGQSLPEVATSYIRGKDEFLNAVDQMQEKATDAYLNSSMRSDPFYKASMDQYLNYLSVLKGRTTQRYMDYLNTSINYQNNQINALQTQYNTAADTVNRLYTNKAAVTTEQYNQIKQALIDMYDNVAQRQQAQATSAKDEIELQKSYYEMLKAAADAQKAQSPNAGKPLSSNDLQILDDTVGGYSNIMDALNSSTLGTYDPGTIFERYSKSRAGKVQDTISNTGSLSSLWNSDKANLSSLAANQQNLASLIPNLSSTTQQYVNSLNSAYSNGILSYLNNHKDKVYSMIGSMKGFKSFDDWKSYNPWFHSANYNTNTYLKGDSAISEDMARLIFNAVLAQQQAGGKVDQGSLTIDDIAGAVFGQLN